MEHVCGHVSRRNLILGTAGVTALGAAGVGVASSANAEFVSGAGDSRYTVSHYDIGDTILLASGVAKRIHGATTMTARANVATTTLKVDFAMKPNSAKISTDGGVTWRTCTISGVAPQQGYRRFYVGGFSLRAGQSFKLRIGYNDTPGSYSGGSTGYYSNSLSYFVAAGEPVSSEFWFPCNNRISVKSTYAISISTQAYNKVLLNNPVSKGGFTSGTTAMVNYKFAVSTPSTPYQLGIAVGPFNVQSGSWTIAGVAVPFHIASLPGKPTSVFSTHTPRALNYFASRYGALPFKHAGAVAVDVMGIGAQETLGAPTYDDDTSKPLFVAHENAHMWFGNAVTGTTWQDAIFFHEGLATLLEDDYRQAYRLSGETWGTLVASPDPIPAKWSTFPVTKPDYGHAASIWQQIRIAMDGTAYEPNAPRFRALLKAMATEHRYGHITRTDFKTLANKYAGKDLSATWMKYGI